MRALLIVTGVLAFRFEWKETSQTDTSFDLQLEPASVSIGTNGVLIDNELDLRVEIVHDHLTTVIPEKGLVRLFREEEAIPISEYTIEVGDQIVVSLLSDHLSDPVSTNAMDLAKELGKQKGVTLRGTIVPIKRRAFGQLQATQPDQCTSENSTVATCAAVSCFLIIVVALIYLVLTKIK